MPNKITKITTPDNTEYDIVDDKAYHTDDSTSTDIADGDYIPLSSASAKKKSTFSNFVAKIKAKLITDTYSGTSTSGMSGKAVKSAIDALDGNLNNTTPSASKTLTAFSQTDGKVSATFGDINISKSQINDFPTIPTVNDATLTIQKNGTNVQTFTANASSNKTANITVPVTQADLTEVRLTNEDLNDVTYPGFYYAAGGNTVTNKPSGYGNFGLVVIHNASGSQYTQIISNEDGSHRRIKKADGTWTSWEAFALESDITNAINALDGSVTGTPGNGKTLTTFSETDGVVTAKFENISITKSQVSDMPTKLSQFTNDSGFATETYVTTAIDALPEPMVFKGSLGTGGTITSLPTNGTATIGDTYKVIKDGTYAETSAKVGDTFICVTKTSSANTWTLIPSGDEPSGTVTNVAIQNGNNGITVSGGPITDAGTLTVSHADTSSQASSTNSGRTYIQSIGLDGYGHVTSLSTATETVTNSDENVKQTADTTTSWRRLALVENNDTEKNSNVFKNSSFWCCTSPIGTTSTVGKSFLAIGNNTSSGTAGNSKGYLRIYGENNKRSQITINGSVTADREVYLPNKDGTIALTDDIPSTYAGSSTAGGAATIAVTAEKLSNTSKIGDANKPVYFKADGTPAAISYTIDKSVPSNAVFTDTKVTQTDDTSTSSEIPILLANSTTTPETATTRKNQNLSFTPSRILVKIQGLYQSWLNGGKYPQLWFKKPTASGSGAVTCIGMDTLAGRMAIATFPSSDEKLYFNYYSDATLSGSTNKKDRSVIWDGSTGIFYTDIIDTKLQTSDISIASGDKLVVTDSNDNNKVRRSSISFDGSTTTKALTQKGTWETFTNNTAANAAPGKVASSSSTGTSTNYARQDHTHGIDLATGDANGQVKIAGTNVSVKGLGSNAYTSTSYLPLAGGDLTGLVTTTSFLVSKHNMTNIDYTQSNNGITGTDNIWMGMFEGRDKNNQRLSRLETVAQPDGLIGIGLSVSNYKTSASKGVNSSALMCYLDKSGTTTYSLASAANFRTALGLGTAAVKNVPSSGNASTSQVVMGNDTRLSDSRTPTSHTHGNIQNDGTLQTTDVAIANNDKLVVTDASNSNKIARTSITFDGSSNTVALTKKGTFEDITKVVQTNDTSTSSGLPLLLANSTTSPETNTTRKNANLTFQPSTHALTVKNDKGYDTYPFTIDVSGRTAVSSTDGGYDVRLLRTSAKYDYDYDATVEGQTVHYSGTKVFETYPISMIANSGDKDGYNAGVRLGSHNGTTIVGAGESSTNFAKAQKAFNNENLYLTADGSVFMYTGLPNNATSYGGKITVNGSGNMTINSENGTAGGGVSWNYLTIGNSTGRKNAGHKAGRITLYGQSATTAETAYSIMLTPGQPTGNRTLTLPNATGTLQVQDIMSYDELITGTAGTSRTVAASSLNPAINAIAFNKMTWNYLASSSSTPGEIKIPVSSVSDYNEYKVNVVLNNGYTVSFLFTPQDVTAMHQIRSGWYASSSDNCSIVVKGSRGMGTGTEYALFNVISCKVNGSNYSTYGFECYYR